MVARKIQADFSAEHTLTNEVLKMPFKAGYTTRPRAIIASVEMPTARQISVEQISVRGPVRRPTISRKP